MTATNTIESRPVLLTGRTIASGWYHDFFLCPTVDLHYLLKETSLKSLSVIWGWVGHWSILIYCLDSGTHTPAFCKVLSKAGKQSLLERRQSFWKGFMNHLSICWHNSTTQEGEQSTAAKVHHANCPASLRGALGMHSQILWTTADEPV